MAQDRRKVIAMRVVAALLIILAIGIGGFPTFLQYQSAQELRNTSNRSAQAVAGWPYPQADEAFAAAKAYNSGLRLRGSRFSARRKTRLPSAGRLAVQ